VKTSYLIPVIALMAAFALSQNARANLVTNGNFTNVLLPSGSSGTNLSGEIGTGSTGAGNYLNVVGWTSTGYNYVYTFVGGTNMATAGTKAGGPNAGMPALQPSEYANTYMWGTGPSGGAAGGNGGTGNIIAPPSGGNFLALDADATSATLNGPVSQKITGLTIGKVYILKFNWAAAQQESFNGATTESLAVTFGAQTFTTGTFSLANHAFSGWMQATFAFTATSGTQTLSFLAGGGPSGLPPFVLLGNVDLEVIPEFSNWMAFAGFGMICIVFETIRRRRRLKVVSENV